MHRLIVTFVLSCGLIACSRGRNPTGPGTVKLHEQSVEVRALRTGQLVIGASIQSQGGQTAVTSPDGSAVLIIANGETGNITAAGFIPKRGISFQGGRQIEYLWEDDAQLPLQFTKELVYGFNQNGIKHLERPVAPVLTVQTDQAILVDRRMEYDLPEALTTVNAVLGQSRTGSTTTFVLDPAATAPLVSIALNPDNRENPGELTWTYIEDVGSVVHCRIEFQTTRAFWGIHLQRALQHAFAHCLGMVHAPSYPGIMGGRETNPSLEFTWMEQQVMRNIFRRPPGNQAPDNAPGMTAASPRRSYKVCALRTS